jgi:hypothetical protein
VSGGSVASAMSSPRRAQERWRITGGAGGALSGTSDGGGKRHTGCQPTGAARKGALSAAHGLSDGITLDKIIDTLCSGSIDRSTTSTSILHGRRRVRRARSDNITNVGFGYAETVGGREAHHMAGGRQTGGGRFPRRRWAAWSSRKTKVTAERRWLRVGTTATFSVRRSASRIHGRRDLPRSSDGNSPSAAAE